MNKTIPAILIVAVCATPARVNAQEPRVRTLTYDSQKKDWVEQAPPLAGTAEGDLYAIRVLNKDREYRKALSSVKTHAKKYGDQDATHPEALLAKAEALIGLKNYDKAHTVLQEFLGAFGGMALTSEALRMEFEIAETYLTGVKRKVWVIFRVSGEELAYQILDEISTDHTDSPLAELAVKTKADHMFRTGEHALAELEYARLLREFPRSRYQQYSLGRTAESALASFGGTDYDEAALIEAQERFQDYRTRFPGPADREGVGLILDGIHEMRAEKDYRIGEYYEKTDHLGSAIFYYRQVRGSFPETIAGTKALARLELLGAVEPVATTNASSTGDGR